MRTVATIFLILLGFTAKAESVAPTCTLTSDIILANLNLDFQGFDQNMTGGWRAISNDGCYLEAAELIEIYHLQNYAALQDSQSQILYWHAGQLYGFEEIRSLAKDRFQKSINPNEPVNDDFKWNAYAKGSIAFLDNNLPDLKKFRAELASAANPRAKLNLSVLDRMIFCFGKSYKEAYTNKAGCTPP